MNLIFLGAPGAGKGSEAKLVAEYFGLIPISTGDIIRENVSNKTKLGLIFKSFIDKGNLVPDELIIKIVKDRLARQDVKAGYILDGFPRTIAQAEALSTFAKVDYVVLIDTDFDVLKNRILSRRVCPSCATTYNTKTYTKSICEKCGDKLAIRSDDTEETIKSRYDIYLSQTSPLIDYYKDKNLLVKVDGNGSIEEVFEKIKNLLVGK